MVYVRCRVTLEFIQLMGNLMPDINGTLGTIISKEGVDLGGLLNGAIGTIGVTQGDYRINGAIGTVRMTR